jgi:hypothetical protein
LKTAIIGIWEKTVASSWIDMLAGLSMSDPRTGGFRRNEGAPLDCDLLAVDETSMVDVPLMRAVLRAPVRATLDRHQPAEIPMGCPGRK